jgi:serine/threonine protein kinase
MAMIENIAIADDSFGGDRTGACLATAGPAPAQLGDYRIIREIGRGGMGVVYEAEQVSLGRHVALKVLPPQLLRDEKMRRRFEREARAAARLHHTNVVPVFGVGEEAGTPCFVMQFIQGQGLDAVLDELRRLRAGGGARDDLPTTAPRDASAAGVARSLLTGRFDRPGGDVSETEAGSETSVASNGGVGTDTSPVSSPSGPSSPSSSSASSLSRGRARGGSGLKSYATGVARIGAEVADALSHAHAQGIVHRDIKPSNLLLDTRGTPWVTDFGLAKADDGPNLTHTGDILGTLRYMPPEAFGGKADARGDIYALRLTLYELLAFRPAFGEKERARLIHQVTSEAPTPLRRLNPEVPRDLETVVHKAIERDPDHRYATASGLADDLRRFVDDEPIRARRAGPVERLAPWGRRNPVIAGLTATVFGLAFAVIAGLWRGNRAAREALVREAHLREEAGHRAAEAVRARDASELARRVAEASRRDLADELYGSRMNLVHAGTSPTSSTARG